jgi:hypothetical protein
LLANLMRARHGALGRLNRDCFRPANGRALRDSESRLPAGEDTEVHKAKYEATGDDKHVTHFKVLVVRWLRVMSY